ncbi:MAG: carboxypeptidase-like regulatory domain-containing protein [Planctomycetota bacterium]
MTRSTLTASVLALLAALGLWWTLHREAPGDDPLQGANVAATRADVGGNAALMEVSGSSADPRHALTAHASLWTVEVVDNKGQAVPEASVRAQMGEAVLAGTGGATWPEPAAGTWTLTVEAAPFPTWQRAVIVLAERPTVTRIVLGEPHTLEGRVRDSYGDPRRYHIIGFVPDNGPVPTSPTEWMKLPNGRTDASGHFMAQLPHRGRWRAFVGFSGKVMYEDPQPVEFTDAGPFQVEFVVQAPTRLLIEAHEPPGATTELPIGVSVYRSAAILDLERPLPPQLRSDAAPDLDDPTLDEEMREEMRAAWEHERAPMSDSDRAALAYRALVVPDGWRMDRSSILDAQRRLLLEFLPVDEELRFAVSRGAEVFRVDGSAWLSASPPVRVRIDLPAANASGAAPPAGPPPVVHATITPVQLPRAPLPVGATWY